MPFDPKTETAPRVPNLIALIREHGKWVDPEPHQVAAR